jgi:hypothetical protein
LKGFALGGTADGLRDQIDLETFWNLKIWRSQVLSNTDNSKNKGALFVHGFSTVIGLLCAFSAKEHPCHNRPEVVEMEVWG